MKKFQLTYVSVLIMFLFTTLSFRFNEQSSMKDSLIKPVLNTSVINDMSTAIGFYIGQSLTLHYIKMNFPDLAQLAEVLSRQFDLQFKDSFENMDEIISKEFSDWDTKKSDLGTTLKDNLNLESTTREQAELFLEQVKLRIKGDMPSPIAETILSFAPTYLNNPAQEFSDNFRKRFSSEGNEKAKGLNFHIDFPESWVAKDGNRPNVVQKMVSQNGNGLANITLLVKQSPELNINSVEELKELIPLNSVEELLPLNSKLLDANYTKIDNAPTLWSEFIATSEYDNESMIMKCQGFYIFYKDKLLFVTCAVGDKIENKDYVEDVYKLYKLLFKSIAISIVINSQWENN